MNRLLLIILELRPHWVRALLCGLIVLLGSLTPHISDARINAVFSPGESFIASFEPNGIQSQSNLRLATENEYKALGATAPTFLSSIELQDRLQTMGDIFLFTRAGVSDTFFDIVLMNKFNNSPVVLFSLSYEGGVIKAAEKNISAVHLEISNEEPEVTENRSPDALTSSKIKNPEDEAADELLNSLSSQLKQLEEFQQKFNQPVDQNMEGSTNSTGAMSDESNRVNTQTSKPRANNRNKFEPQENNVEKFDQSENYSIDRPGTSSQDKAGFSVDNRSQFLTRPADLNFQASAPVSKEILELSMLGMKADIQLESSELKNFMLTIVAIGLLALTMVLVIVGKTKKIVDKQDQKNTNSHLAKNDDPQLMLSMFNYMREESKNNQQTYLKTLELIMQRDAFGSSRAETSDALNENNTVRNHLRHETQKAAVKYDPQNQNEVAHNAVTNSAPAKNIETKPVDVKSRANYVASQAREEVSSKVEEQINLAKVYKEMGDIFMAQQLLNDIINTGSPAEVKAAEDQKKNLEQK